MPKPLTIEKLDHRYGQTAVFDDLDLEVDDGELIAVLGESGCGKTTLLRAIAGLVTPNHGSIYIGEDLVAKEGKLLIPIEQRKIGLVFQDYALFPYMSVRENIGFGLGQTDKQRVDELLELTGITPLADRRPQALSGGQQQRVALARALAPRPHLLLLDEPFANVDASRRSQLGSQLVQTLREEGRAGLFVTHDQADAMAYASRVAVFTHESNSSSIRQCDIPECVFRNPLTKAVAKLLGPASFISAKAEGDIATSVLGTHALKSPSKGQVELMYRSDELQFDPAENGPAEVTQEIYLGTHYRLTLKTPAGEIVCDSARASSGVGTKGNVTARGPAWVMP